MITERARHAAQIKDDFISQNTSDYRLLVDNDSGLYRHMNQLIVECANRKHKNGDKSVTEFWRRQRSFMPRFYGSISCNRADLYLNWVDRFLSPPGIDILQGIALYRARTTALFYNNPDEILAAVPKTNEDLRYFIDGRSLEIYEYLDLPLYVTLVQKD